MITSMGNAQVKQLLQWQKKAKQRNKDGIFLVEGIRMSAEVPKERLQNVYVSKSFYEKKKEMLDKMQIPCEILADDVFARVSDTQTPQGILCVVKQSIYKFEEVTGGKRVHLMVLDNLQDPGNLGTIFRTAEGAGVSGIILSKDCVDIYNPKTIRSTMGAIYRMPFIYVEDLPEACALLKKKEICLYAAHLDGAHFYDEEDYSGGCAFLIGNEGNGLRDEVAACADVRIKIPMHGQVESLNAAVAASILMYEVCRQRRKE